MTVNCLTFKLTVLYLMAKAKMYLKTFGTKCFKRLCVQNRLLKHLYFIYKLYQRICVVYVPITSPKMVKNSV